MAYTWTDPRTRTAYLVWRALVRWQAQTGPRPNPTLPVLPPQLQRDVGLDRVKTLPALPNWQATARLALGRGP